jgi:hypothetical protein
MAFPAFVAVTARTCIGTTVAANDSNNNYILEWLKRAFLIHRAMKIT